MKLQLQNIALFVLLCLASAAGLEALHRTSHEGNYDPSEGLSKAEKIGVGLLPSPEDLALDRGKKSFFTGCGDGWIKRVWLDRTGDEQVENWTYVGGRPLGVALAPNDELIVCELYKGLLKATKNKVEVLCTEAGGLEFKSVDGVDVTKEGVVYFTDASDKSTPPESEDPPSGRLIKYDPNTKTTTVLLTDLYYANGVALSAQEDFLVFCETLIFSCKKYWLKGTKSGKVETFAENLPGLPDNVRLDDEGTFWIGLLGTRIMVGESIAKYPTLRHVPARLWSIINKAGGIVGKAGILGVRDNGDSIAFFSDPQRTLITGGLKVGNSLYFVSINDNFFNRLEL